MARDYKGTGKKAEKQGEGLGGGPVGSSGGYSGRPGGSQPSQNRPSSAPRPGGPQNPGGPNRPDNGERQALPICCWAKRAMDREAAASEASSAL